MRLTLLEAPMLRAKHSCGSARGDGAWYGSKATSGLCQPLIAAMPPHATYIETHLGGGAIMQRKPLALRNIGIDRSARAIGAFRCEYEVELVHGCCHRFLSEFPFAGDERPRWFRCEYEVELVHGCCHRFLSEFPFAGDELYSDPPYLHTARKSQRRYRYDYTPADHEHLLALLQGLRCAVMLSGYPSELYERALSDWHSLSLGNHLQSTIKCGRYPTSTSIRGSTRLLLSARDMVFALPVPTHASNSG